MAAVDGFGDAVVGRSFVGVDEVVSAVGGGEVDLRTGKINFYALRRREPTDQPLLNTTPYELPKKPFKE